MGKSPNLFSTVINRILKTFFYLLYHRFAWAYDFVAASVSVGMWDEWVFSVLPDLEGPMVLELGHGPGHLQLALRKNSIQSFGLDQSREMSSLASQRLLLAGYSSLLVNGIAQHLPFSTSIFHQVVATFPTEFIVDHQTLEEVIRVLKPGGNLLMLPVARITGEGFVHRIASWLFYITGQTPEWDDRMLIPFQDVGFTARVEYTKMESSELILIRAEKRNTYSQ